MGIAHVLTAIEALLTECLDDMPVTTRKRIADVVMGVLVSGTLVLRQVATTLAHVGVSTATAASHERRLRRTLNDTHICAVPTFTRVVRRILHRLHPGQTVRILIDESGHSNVVRILVAALWYRGRAVPLAWVLWPAQQPHDKAYWTDCDMVLAHVATILPAGLHVTIIGDRAFGCPAFTDLVTARGWDYLVRVQGQTRFRDDDGEGEALRTVASTPGMYWCRRGQVFKKHGWRTASVVIYWRRACEGPLIVVSSLSPQWVLVRLYRLRHAIEALFRDWKHSGWQWESSQVYVLAHQEVLVLILALSTVLTLCLGEEAAQELLEQPPQQGHRRPWAARMSLFRLGRERLWERLWRGDTRPVTWEVSQMDAPNWSEECWRASRPDATPVYTTERVGTREHRRYAA